jgi:hypothetical protein
MSKKLPPMDDMDELPTVPSLALGRVTGGAGMDMTSMAMMMMAMKSKGAQAPAATPPPPQAPKLMVDGVAQQLQSDGQGGYIVNDDETGGMDG